MKRMGLWERGMAVVRMGGFGGGWLSPFCLLFFFLNDSDSPSVKKFRFLIH